MKKNETSMEDFGCDLKPKPIIKKLEEALKRDSVVHLEGYVGSSIPQLIPCTYSMPPFICGKVRDALDGDLPPGLRKVLQEFYNNNCGGS